MSSEGINSTSGTYSNIMLLN